MKEVQQVFRCHHVSRLDVVLACLLYDARGQSHTWYDLVCRDRKASGSILLRVSLASLKSFPYSSIRYIFNKFSAFDQIPTFFAAQECLVIHLIGTLGTRPAIWDTMIQAHKYQMTLNEPRKITVCVESGTTSQTQKHAMRVVVAV